MRRAAIPIFLLIAASVARSAEIRWSRASLDTIAKWQKLVVRRNGLFELRTRNYLVRTGVDARFTAETAFFLDEVHSCFDRLLPGASQLDVLPQVVIFGSREEYRAVSGDNSRGMFRWEFETRNGVRTMTEFAVYSFAAAPAERVFSRFPHYILLHEGTHQILQSRAGYTPIPAWFNEGCAAFLEQWDLSSGIDQNIDAIVRKRRSAASVNDALRRNELGPLSDLAKLNRLDTDGFGRQTGVNYARAESLFVFLMSDAKRRTLLRSVYEEVIRGGDAGRLLFAGESGPQFEAEWLRWVRTPPPRTR